MSSSSRPTLINKLESGLVDIDEFINLVPILRDRLTREGFGFYSKASYEIERNSAGEIILIENYFSRSDGGDITHKAKLNPDEISLLSKAYEEYVASGFKVYGPSNTLANVSSGSSPILSTETKTAANLSVSSSNLTSMKLGIKTDSGKLIVLPNISETHTVKDVREQVAKKRQVTPQEITLKFQNILLNDDTMLIRDIPEFNKDLDNVPGANTPEDIQLSDKMSRFMCFKGPAPLSAPGRNAFLPPPPQQSQVVQPKDVSSLVDKNTNKKS